MLRARISRSATASTPRASISRSRGRSWGLFSLQLLPLHPVLNSWCSHSSDEASPLRNSRRRVRTGRQRKRGVEHRGGRRAASARGSRGQGARGVASGRPGLSPVGTSPCVSNRPRRTRTDLLSDPLGSSHVVRTTDRAGVVLHVELRFTVQTHIRQRLLRRQPCRALGPVQNTHRDHTPPSRALTKKSQDSSHRSKAPLSGGFVTVYIPPCNPPARTLDPPRAPREGPALHAEHPHTIRDETGQFLGMSVRIGSVRRFPNRTRGAIGHAREHGRRDHRVFDSLESVYRPKLASSVYSSTTI